MTRLSPWLEPRSWAGPKRSMPRTRRPRAASSAAAELPMPPRPTMITSWEPGAPEVALIAGDGDGLVMSGPHPAALRVKAWFGHDVGAEPFPEVLYLDGLPGAGEGHGHEHVRDGPSDAVPIRRARNVADGFAL